MLWMKSDVSDHVILTSELEKDDYDRLANSLVEDGKLEKGSK